MYVCIYAHHSEHLSNVPGSLHAHTHTHTHTPTHTHTYTHIYIYTHIILSTCQTCRESARRAGTVARSCTCAVSSPPNHVVFELDFRGAKISFLQTAFSGRISAILA